MNVLFVCTGNTCCSPLAVAIARAFAAGLGRGSLRLASAGTDVWVEGVPATVEADMVASE